jgi:hypothetical protein
MLKNLKDEIRSLQALSTALNQLDQPLDESIQGKLGELTIFIKELRLIIRKNDSLNKYYNEALNQPSSEKEKRTETRLINTPVKNEHSLLEPEELGEKIWQGIDTQQHVDEEKDSEEILTKQLTESTQPAQRRRMFRKQGVLVIEAGASSELDISTFISEMREERIQSQLREISL